MNRRELLRRGVQLAAACAVSPAGGAERAAAVGRAVARTPAGILIGRKEAGCAIYRGIRYAAARRFEPARPAPDWHGERPALGFGAQCPQINPDSDAWLDRSPMSEDCLFLNIWAPDGADSLPVMLWIHGGGYWWGSGHAPMYDGSHFATRERVVYVTVNHRLSGLGFLYLGGLSKEFATSANLGLADLVEALRWIKRNIAGFGGDPSNVTIFGESGGGFKVSTLLAMPAAQGLFHKAIVESGSCTQFQEEEKATEAARLVLSELELTPERVATLRSMPAGRIVEACDRLVRKIGLWDIAHNPFVPVRHSGSLPFQASDPEAMRLSSGIPMIIGSNSEETAWLLASNGTIPRPSNDEQLVSLILEIFRSRTVPEVKRMIELLRQQHAGIDRQRLLVRITSFFWMGEKALKQVENRAETCTAPAYLYTFGWEDPMFGGTWAAHAAEVPFVLGHLDLAHVMGNEDDIAVQRAASDPAGHRYELSGKLMSTWAHFARTGTPSAAGLPGWPAFTTASRSRMWLDARCSVDRISLEGL